MSEIDDVCAEVRVSGTYIRMFSEYAAGEVKITVFDVDSREWVARFVTANSIEEGEEEGRRVNENIPGHRLSFRVADRALDEE